MKTLIEKDTGTSMFIATQFTRAKKFTIATENYSSQDMETTQLPINRWLA